MPTLVDRWQVMLALDLGFCPSYTMSRTLALLFSCLSAYSHPIEAQVHDFSRLILHLLLVPFWACLHGLPGAPSILEVHSAWSARALTVCGTAFSNQQPKAAFEGFHRLCSVLVNDLFMNSSLTFGTQENTLQPPTYLPLGSSPTRF